MGNKDIEKKKLATGYERFVTALANRRKLGIENYFGRLSLNSLMTVALLIVLLSLIYLGFYDVLKDRPNRQVLESTIKMVFYVPYIATLGLSLIFIKPKRTFSLMYLFLPLIMILYTLAYFTEYNILIIIATSILGILLGIISTAVILIYLFDLTSAEQLISALLLTFVVSGFYIFKFLTKIYHFDLFYLRYLIPMIFMLISFVLLFLVDKSDYTDIEFRDEKLPVSTIVILIIIVSLIFINDGIFYSIRQIHGQNPDAYTIGFIIATISAFLIFVYCKNSIYISIIIYFIMLLLTYEVGIFNELFDHQNTLLSTFELMMGITNSIGIISAMMMVGKVLEDKASYSAFKIFALFIPFYILGSRFLSIGIKVYQVKVVLTVGICIMTLLFLVTLLINIKAALDSKASKNSFLGTIKDNINRFKAIDPDEVLTKKEKVVFELLLEGYTLKQIAEEIGSKYDAVNFHYKHIYKKLEVNSKIELILRYGNEKQRENQQ